MGTSSHAKSTWSVRERPKTGPRPSLETADPQKRSFHLPLTLTKGDISKSLERGHFYFPLTRAPFALTGFSASGTLEAISMETHTLKAQPRTVTGRATKALRD